MAHPFTVNVKGGKGGSGELGIGQGGPGGDGLGPTLNIGTATVHVQGGAEINIRDRDIIINWLSPINFFLRQADISQVRAKGTGEWLLNHPLFMQWESGSERTLWCHGIPGAGKTVLASMVVDHLSAAFRNNKDIGVACIYLNHKEADQQPPPKLLAGVWRQLVLNRDIGFIAESLYKQHREKGTVPSLEEVANVLSSSLKEFSQVFIIVDAMDEYPEFQREILLQQLAVMGSNVNLMITSRPNISPEPSSFPNLETLDIQAAPEDIQAYINAQIKLSPRLSKHIRKKPVLREEILKKTMDTVDGMFLLAKLQIDSLMTKRTIWAVQEALNSLPKDLYGSYDIAIQRIDAQSKEDRRTARSTIIWVANAKRPLMIEELQVALAVEPGMRQLNEENLMDINIILSVCAGLVIVDKESSVVRLVHYTTQEYLDSIQALLFPEAPTEITCTLLTFLAFEGYPDSSWERWNLPPLVEYSQGEYGSSLQAAAARGHTEIVSILLEKGADVNAAGGRYGSSLQAAAAGGHTEIVSILLEKGADVNAAGGRYGSSLQAAADQGHTEIVGILLEKGADINAAGGLYGSSLQAAAAEGHTEIVSILLEKGADVNTAGGRYGSSLQAAAAGGHTEIVGILLEKGADINAAGGKYGSSLQAAAARGHTEIVSILLEKGADVNAAGGLYGSSLQAAADQGHTETVSMLLERGARFPLTLQNERNAQG
ncbi:ankyrin repeat-containing domain protein [Mycena vulgaris]|nr:ankyrin repeat-containing domain protein [Mycena vulgaris]